MENVWDQTSVYAPQGIKELTVMKVEYNTQNNCQSYVSNFLTRSPASFTSRISICCSNNVSYWLQMWMSAVSWRDRVPSAAWTHTVAIAVTVNLDTHSVQMDTPAPVSNFLFKLNNLMKICKLTDDISDVGSVFSQKAICHLYTIIGG